MTALTRTGTAVAKAADRLEAAKAARDAAIRAARAEGIGPNQIADETGLSRQQVWNIVKTPTPDASSV